MTKEFNPDSLPEEKKEEILTRMAKSREEKKLCRARQREAGKRESENRKKLLKFASEKNIQFFEVYSLCRGGYTTLCGYVPPVRKPNEKAAPVASVAYAISCCSPTDKYDEEKGKILIIERLRNGVATVLSYRKNMVPEKTEKTRIPALIDLDLIRTAATGINTHGAVIPQAVVNSDPNE